MRLYTLSLQRTDYDENVQRLYAYWANLQKFLNDSFIELGVVVAA